jgi:large repetitive protein
VQIPRGLTTYSTQVDATATLGVLVEITAGINLQTGVVTWTFTSLDPSTGFLPPDATPPAGEGLVSYTIEANPNDTTGAVIPAQATVVFDTNAPIDTAVVSNTTDDTTPKDRSLVGQLKVG